MHTRLDIALCNLSEENSISLLEKIVKEIKRIEQLSDRFDVQSEISKTNSLSAIEPYKISSELYSILEKCIEYKLLTSGAFDITVQSRNKYLLGISDIVLNPVSKTVFFKNENVQIDLCGYIKGYALDRVKSMLTENNCFNALVNIGNSSVFALGNHPYGKGWKVNLPDSEKAYITLSDQCLTNSGNSIHHLHILHPDTGEYVKPTETVSVITENAVQGEVLSTALCVCNPKNRELICRKLGGELALVEN